MARRVHPHGRLAKEFLWRKASLETTLVNGVIAYFDGNELVEEQSMIITSLIAKAVRVDA